MTVPINVVQRNEGDENVRGPAISQWAKQKIARNRLIHKSPFYSVAENLRSNSLKSQNVRHDIFDGEESSISMVWKHLISNCLLEPLLWEQWQMAN
jgi:hypothetical protein